MEKSVKFLVLALIACSFVGCGIYPDDKSCAKVVIDALGAPNQIIVTAETDSGTVLYYWDKPDGSYTLTMFKGSFGWYIDSLKRTQETERESRSEEITNVYIWSRNYRGNR